MKKILIISLLICSLAQADEITISVSQQSSRFLSYWKSSVVTPQQDQRIALVESVFQRLLRAWDSARLEPGLYVVDSGDGPWAASLVDGNILLSLKALETILSFDAQQAEHLLAFVLAHELAHQRSDDLWQHRFFRLDRQQVEAEQRDIPQQLQIEKRRLAEKELKEARADHDGLILMSSVGFNPYFILGEKDFFTQWVESLWQYSCEDQTDVGLSDACQQAKSRALRAHYQLDNVASQSSLYQLGIQSLVANKLEKARYYFTQYGRNFPSRAVMTALGISFLGEAIQLRNKLIQDGLISAPLLYYPLILDADAGIDADNRQHDLSVKRAAVEGSIRQQRQHISRLVDQAVSYFEKAIQLKPDHPNSYILLASAYLLSENSYRVRGVVQGRYIPRFGTDKVAELMLALTSSVEGQLDAAIRSLQGLADSALSNETNTPIDEDLFRYSLGFNLAALLNFIGQSEPAEGVWQQVARRAQTAGNAYLFRLALGQLPGNRGGGVAILKQAPSVNGLRPGNKKTRDDSAHSINELWIEGEPFHVYNYHNGSQFITGADGRIISARQQAGLATLGGLLKPGDAAQRPIKTLGLPDRRLHLVSGEYLAYDQYGLALHIDEGEVKGWFLY